MIKEKLGMETELLRGSGGVFEVFIEQTKVYSKKQTGEFPEDEHIIALIEKVQSLNQ